MVSDPSARLAGTSSRWVPLFSLLTIGSSNSLDHAGICKPYSTRGYPEKPAFLVFNF